eukprot:gene30953-38253_t
MKSHLFVVNGGIIVFILYGLYGSLKNSSSNTNNYYNQVAASAQFSAASTSGIVKGSVVSLSAIGSIQTGAGTSIYKNIADISAKCPSYLSMDAVYENAYLISYANKVSFTSTLQVVQVADTPNTAKVVSTLDTPYDFYDIITLSTGTLDPTTLTIKISEAQIFLDNPNYSVYQ